MIFWVLAEVLIIAHFPTHIGMLYSYTEAVCIGEEKLRFQKVVEPSVVVSIMPVTFR